MPQVTHVMPQVAFGAALRLPAVADGLTVMPDIAHVVSNVRPVMASILPIVAQLIGSVVLGRAGPNRRVRPSRAGPMRAAGMRRGCASAPAMTTACMTASATAVCISTTRPSRQRANQTYRRKVMEHSFLDAQKNWWDHGRRISPDQT